MRYRLLLASFSDEEIFVQVYVKDTHTHTQNRSARELGFQYRLPGSGAKLTPSTKPYH